MDRKATFHALAWFWDLHQRSLLDLDPPYQRRSVWNLQYKEFFIDTVLNNFPCPAIFLFEDISPDGSAKYSVVDGKQRLVTLFEFKNNEFAVSSNATIIALRERYFDDLNDETKRNFWRYQFSVEFIPSEDERLINDIFDRINRNVAKLTRQELRHAKYGGVFITDIEDLTEWMLSMFPRGFPNIAAQSRKQMKDCELVGQLFLLLEGNPRSLSQDDLDQAFSERDTEWLHREAVTERFRSIITYINDILRTDGGIDLQRSRLRNQADFYSLVGAISSAIDANQLPDAKAAAERLTTFITCVEDEACRAEHVKARDYYLAARSASNDAGPRRTRINILTEILTITED